MPNRIIREDILSSENVDKLDYAAEVFYRRLLNRVDDYGRFYANAHLLLANLYPLRSDVIKCSQINEWLSYCVLANLLVVYEFDGKIYLQVEKFRQQLRSPSKFPDPNHQNADHMISDAKQVSSNGNHLNTLSVSVSEDVSVSVIRPCIADAQQMLADDTQSADKPPKKSKSRVFSSKPETREECVEHCSKNLGLTENDGKALWDHWMGNGFRNNGKPMTSWRHVASNWTRRRMFFPSLQEVKSR